MFSRAESRPEPVQGRLEGFETLLTRHLAGRPWGKGESWPPLSGPPARKCPSNSPPRKEEEPNTIHFLLCCTKLLAHAGVACPRKETRVKMAKWHLADTRKRHTFSTREADSHVIHGGVFPSSGIQPGFSKIEP